MWQHSNEQILQNFAATYSLPFTSSAFFSQAIMAIGA